MSPRLVNWLDQCAGVSTVKLHGRPVGRLLDFLVARHAEGA